MIELKVNEITHATNQCSFLNDEPPTYITNQKQDFDQITSRANKNINKGKNDKNKNRHNK